jgi:hypothetical protein
MFLYLVTGFGGIKGYNYIKLTYQTGGGKIAVTKELFNINSDFWNRNSFLFGAGAANTISRSAGMTYPGYNGNAPALKFGVPPAKEWPYFTNLAKGNFYVGDSSATSPVSSLLGVLGDYGIFGLVSFIYSYYGRISRNNFDSSNSRKSFIGFSLLFIFVLSYINDWLELTVASITFFAILGLLFTEEAEDEM